MKFNRVILLALLTTYAVLWTGGVVTYLFLSRAPLERHWTAPAFLVTAAVLTMYLAGRGQIWQLVAAGLVGMAAEFAGLKWGVPFGRYSYTGVLYPTVMGVPLAIGCAWLILFAYVRQMLVGTKLSRLGRAAVGSLWMTGLDLLIDPLAAGPLGYWSWTERGWYYGIPASNFAGWFVVSLILFLILPLATGKSRGLVWVGFSIVIFFALIAARQLMVGILPVAALLILSHFVVLREPKTPNVANHDETPSS